MLFVKLSDSEFEVINLMWEAGRPLSFKELQEHFDNNTDKIWKKQTLNTFLYRMQHKGILCAKEGERYKVYIPTMTKDEYIKAESTHFLQKRFGGSLAKMLIAFSGGDKIPAKEADELIAIIEDWKENA